MKNQTKYWFLENFDFMKKLGKANLMAICDELEMDYMNKGDIIQYASSNESRVIFLKKGSVKIIDSKSNQTKYIVRENNIFGELDPTNESNEIAEHAQALEDSVVCFIESDRMIDLLEKNPSLKNYIIKFQALKIKKLERRLSDLLYKDSETRIQEFLYNYINENGETDQLVSRAKTSLHILTLHT